MEYRVGLVIMSHLSDAQYLSGEALTMKLNFVKLLVNLYPNTDTLISKEELDKQWKGLEEHYNQVNS